jgi:transposase
MAQLGGWEGYGVAGWRHEQRGDRRWLIVELVPSDGVARCCSGCGASVAAIHDRSMRRIRDLPLFEHPVELRVPRLRPACPACGPRLQRLAWLDPHCRVTRRLAESVARLCAVTSVLHAARWYGIDWKTAKAIELPELGVPPGPGGSGWSDAHRDG